MSQAAPGCDGTTYEILKEGDANGKEITKGWYVCFFLSLCLFKIFSVYFSFVIFFSYHSLSDFNMTLIS
jgi:hypothetical protein